MSMFYTMADVNAAEIAKIGQIAADTTANIVNAVSGQKVPVRGLCPSTCDCPPCETLNFDSIPDAVKIGLLVGGFLLLRKLLV